MRGAAWVLLVSASIARLAVAESLPVQRFELPALPPQASPASSAIAQLTVTAPPPSRMTSQNAASEEDAFTDRVLRYTELRSRIEQREGSVLDELAARYAKLTQFTARLEQRDEAAFDERATRFARLVEFTHKLRLEQEARETEDFESQLERALRAQAFMKRLSQDRREHRIAVPDTLAPEPEEWTR